MDCQTIHFITNFLSSKLKPQIRGEYTTTQKFTEFIEECYTAGHEMQFRPGPLNLGGPERTKIGAEPDLPFYSSSKSLRFNFCVMLAVVVVHKHWRSFVSPSFWRTFLVHLSVRPTERVKHGNNQKIYPRLGQAWSKPDRPEEAWVHHRQSDHSQPMYEHINIGLKQKCFLFGVDGILCLRILWSFLLTIHLIFLAYFCKWSYVHR